MTLLFNIQLLNKFNDLKTGLCLVLFTATPSEEFNIQKSVNCS